MIDRARGALDPGLLLFCFVPGHFINHSPLTCLIRNVMVLSTDVNYDRGGYTKADRKQTEGKEGNGAFRAPKHIQLFYSGNVVH